MRKSRRTCFSARQGWTKSIDACYTLALKKRLPYGSLSHASSRISGSLPKYCSQCIRYYHTFQHLRCFHKGRAVRTTRASPHTNHQHSYISRRISYRLCYETLIPPCHHFSALSLYYKLLRNTMGVELVIRGLIADIDQLNKLYRQLHNVPHEVQKLFDLLANSRQLLALSIARLSNASSLIDPGNDAAACKLFSRFRSKLVDLELFLDPQYQLHQSGPRSELRNAVPWAVTDKHLIHDTCQTFQTHLSRLDNDCQTLFSFLQS